MKVDAKCWRAWLGLWFVEVNKTGAFWSIELTSMITGEIVDLVTRGTLGTAKAKAEGRAREHPTTHLEKS